MKFIQVLIVAAFSIIVLSCSDSSSDNYEASANLTVEEQKAFLQEISRYIGELPKNGGYETRNESRFDSHYVQQAEQSGLKYYYEDTNSGTVYFLVTQIAPSIHEKYVALGGKLKRSGNNTINEYEEVFRTWKFPMKDLEPKAIFLFQKMVKGEDLSPFYSDKKGDQYIEFPNQYSRYDKNLRHWISIGNPLDSLYRLREVQQKKGEK